jgi:hypothetical protein
MSHIATVEIKITDLDALQTACQNLGVQCEIGQINATLFAGQKAKGNVSIKLKGWNYPIVIDTEKGEAQYDNYNGSWGKMEEFELLQQEYSKQVALSELSEGFSVSETLLEDGTIELEFEQY